VEWKFDFLLKLIGYFLGCVCWSAGLCFGLRKMTINRCEMSIGCVPCFMIDLMNFGVGCMGSLINRVGVYLGLK
jgi:hypothetical protein